MGHPTRTFSSMKNGSPETFSNFLSGKSGCRSGMKLLTLFFLHKRDGQTETVKPSRIWTGPEEPTLANTPCDCELDEVQQVLGTVTNGAGLVAVSTASHAPGGHKQKTESPSRRVINWEQMNHSVGRRTALL